MKPNWRQWLFWLLIGAFFYVLTTRLGELKQLAETLRQGVWLWLVAALVLQILYFTAITAIYQTAFAAVGVSGRVREMLPLTFASIFINTTAPTGGAVGTAIYIDDAQRRGQSAARATAASLVALVANLGVFAFILVLGLMILFVGGQVTRLQLLSAVILFAFVAALLTVLSLGFWWPERLRQLLERLEDWINGLGRLVKRPSLLSPDWGAKNAADVTAAADAFRQQPREVTRTLSMALLAHLANMGVLFCIFLSFSLTVSPGALLTIYAMTMLFSIVSPTPNGVGVVETLMPVIYTSLGVDAATGTVINLTFRGLSFWLPLIVGFLLLRRLHLFQTREEERVESSQVRFVAILTGFVGLVNVLSAIRPALAARFDLIEGLLPLLARDVGNIVAVLAGFALLVLSVGLWRYQRSAWQVIMIVLALSIVSNLLKGSDYEEALLSGLLALYLWLQRAHFDAQADPLSARYGVAILLGAVFFTLAYGTIGFYLLGEEYQIELSPGAALSQTMAQFSSFGRATLPLATRYGHYFVNSIYVVAATTIGAGLLLLLRPVLARSTANPVDSRSAEEVDSS